MKLGRREIIDEFTDLPISAQLKFELRKKKEKLGSLPMQFYSAKQTREIAQSIQAKEIETVDRTIEE